MAYRDLDPRLNTDLELDLSKLDLSHMADTYADEIQRQAVHDLKEACPPGWRFDEIEHDGLELRNGKLFIVNVSAKHATFDEDEARFAFEENTYREDCA